MGQKPAGPPPPIRTRPRCGPHGSGAGPAARRRPARRRFGNVEPGGPPWIPHLGWNHPVRRPAPRRARLRKPLPGRPGAIRRQPSGSAVPETGIGRTGRRCAEGRTAPSRGRSGAPDHPPRLPGTFPGPCPGPAAKSGPNAKRVPKRRRRARPVTEPDVGRRHPGSPPERETAARLRLRIGQFAHAGVPRNGKSRKKSRSGQRSGFCRTVFSAARAPGNHACGLSPPAVNISHTPLRSENPIFCKGNARIVRFFFCN